MLGLRIKCFVAVERHIFLQLSLNQQSMHSRRFITPKAEYLRRLAASELMPDEAQKKATKELDALYQKLQTYTPKAKEEPSFLDKLFGSKKEVDPASLAPKGLYLFGSVGGGKTTLMDLFYDCCTEVRGKLILKIYVICNK